MIFSFFTSFQWYHQKPLIGIKGRVQSNIYEVDEKKRYDVEVIAEKVTFLSSKPKDENPNNEEAPKKHKKAD